MARKGFGLVPVLLGLGALYGAVFATSRAQDERPPLTLTRLSCSCSDGSRCDVQRENRWLPWGVRESTPQGTAALVQTSGGDVFRLTCPSGRIQLERIAATAT